MAAKLDGPVLIPFCSAAAPMGPRGRSPAPWPRPAGFVGPDVIRLPSGAARRRIVAPPEDAEYGPAPVMLPAIEPGPRGRGRAALEAWIDSLDEAYQLLGDECQRVYELQMKAQARLNAAKLRDRSPPTRRRGKLTRPDPASI